ncbi:pentatricopeptide repeat protein [Coprinopsis cinerea okayama7|uniref:Pentatricopeptide repeat protein n=1 Tax=Coprinopsis cinerea (strain Okayama-7 / 130 / ATCC MYA-4618 / FGSC 9003) TaxID=240176 RepID=A8P7Q0_COPC7|nr:pentatricopeptide repeat protein [Coprinopsis cinerea okayama7\|eukprot:XP_001839408.1 pentatricopeptide repeat protein [Coprinopsis cinerea okayama7\
MLPKVATHLLHSTTRSAAAAVHNQTSTLRNVFQGGASGPSGAGASGTKSKSTAGPSKSKPVAAKPTTPAPSKAVKPVTIALVTASGSSLASPAAPTASSSSSSTKSQDYFTGANPSARAENSNAGNNGQGRSSSGSNGGAKNPKAGRRFYTSYNSASRAVTQANAIIVTEDVSGLSSHEDSHSLSSPLSPSASQESRRALLKASSSSANASASQRRTRLRSSSVNTLLPRNEKDQDGASPGVMEKISVLKTVQLQARSLHVLSAAATKAATASAAQQPPTPTSSVSTSNAAAPGGEELTVQVEVETEGVEKAAVSAEATQSQSPPSPRRPASRSASPLPRARSPLRRRNSTSSVQQSRPASPLLFAEEPTQVEVHLARRNSTASAPIDAQAKDAKEAPASPAATPASPSISDASASEVSEAQSTSTKATSVAEEGHFQFKATYTHHGTRIKEAKDKIEAIEAVRALIDASNPPQQDLPTTVRSRYVWPTTADYNQGIQALLHYRAEGEPIVGILELYETLMRQSERPGAAIRPNARTYLLLIDAFTKRDWDIHRMIVGLKANQRNREVRTSAEMEVDQAQAPELRRIQSLTAEAENNFRSALRLFDAVNEVTDGFNIPDLTLFKALLRTCATHGNVRAALKVFGEMESRLEKGTYLDAETYKYLLQAFTNAGDFEGAEKVFEGFKQKWTDGQIFQLTDGKVSIAKRMQVQMWNQMLEAYFRKGEPEKAVDLLDSMLKASTTPATDDASTSALPLVPSPASSTFTTIIGGFIKMGDVSTAYLWFKRLLQENDTPHDDPFVGAVDGRAMKPDQVAWTLMLDGLATAGKVTELNETFMRLVQGTSGTGSAVKGTGGTEEPMSLDGVRVLRSYRHLVYLANMDWLKDAPTSTPEELEFVMQRLDFLNSTVIPQAPSASPRHWDFGNRQMVDGLAAMYVKYGAFEKGFDVMNKFIGEWLTLLNRAERTDDLWQGPEGPAGVVLEVQNMALGFWDRCAEALNAREGAMLPWNVAIGLALLNAESLGLKITPDQAVWLLASYTTYAANEPLAPEVARLLLGCSIHVETAGIAYTWPASLLTKEGGLTASVLQHIASNGIAFDDNLTDLQTRLDAVDVVCRGHNLEQRRPFFTHLGPSYAQAFEQQVALRYEALKNQLEEAAPSQPLMAQQPERIDMEALPQMTKSYGALTQHASLSRDVDLSLKNMSLSTEERAERAYQLFHTALETRQVVPHVPSLSRLIQACGRLGQLERVREVYHVAQMMITNLRHKMSEAKRKDLWVMVEDGMIIALAHAGDVEGAHVHRRRILQYGGANEIAATGSNALPWAAPSADAYGALILHIKDTTDDATNSLMLWNEAMRVGVTPNLYLFNNIISKLSRARKADYALELFHTMREQGIVPSSITYGAVIGACARVGDVVSAETLFREMVEQTNFKPRVPPYNTMMQVYTTTKPDRERALWYYEEMKKAGVHPTAHTYKLLLDLYGSVEPLDIASMERVFEELKRNPRIQLQGTHFASLVNAYGCVLKDLDKAIATFDSIPSHLVNGKPLIADAVVYEAMVNALVANKRTDLIPAFMERMSQDQVHMTAYVANFLIKGYANVGDIDQARSIFESMSDPPTGVAAPNNHAPHDPSAAGESVGVMEPVYREPSTWEAMIRAELGVGNRDRAYELLERLKVRQYPEAVFNRISGVMVDHSTVVLP